MLSLEALDPVPVRIITTMARVLLLISSLAKEQDCSLFSRLTKCEPFLPLMQWLQLTIACWCPSSVKRSWASSSPPSSIPPPLGGLKIVGNMLLFFGHQTCFLYLKYTIRQVTTSIVPHYEHLPAISERIPTMKYWTELRIIIQLLQRIILIHTHRYF